MPGEFETRLLDVMDAEERIYLELHNVLQNEHASIAELDAEGIEAAVRAKEALGFEAQLLEETRMAVVEAEAVARGWPRSRPTLTEVCELLGDARPLHAAHSRLVALVGAVRELTDMNATFASDSMAQVRATLQLLGRLVPEEATYRACGDAAPARRGRLVQSSA